MDAFDIKNSTQFVDELEREHIREEIFVQSISTLFQEGANQQAIFRHMSPFVDRLLDHMAKEEILAERVKDSGIKNLIASHRALTDLLYEALGVIEVGVNPKQARSLWDKFCDEFHKHMLESDGPLYKLLRESDVPMDNQSIIDRHSINSNATIIMTSPKRRGTDTTV
ncbi:MAG: hypothetical protein WCJ64_09910 [Rhodospirillaceae bacterium]